MMHSDAYEYRRHLPHWRKEGALYLVTFRLADSIPRHVMEAWKQERRIWMVAHGLNSNLPERNQMERYLAIPEEARCAFEQEQKHRYILELDRCHGACLLRNREVAQYVVKALDFHHGRDLQCGDFIIMPNHVHVILAPFPGKTLERLLQSIKRHSAVQINTFLGRTGVLWQKESYDHIIRDGAEFGRIRKYIADNPVKAGLKPGEYFYRDNE